MHHSDQADALLGMHAEQLAAICRVDRTTAMRWKAGASRMPFAAFALVQQVIEGFLPPGTGWAGWQFRRDGRLYAPDLKRGFLPHHVMQLEYLIPMLRWYEYQGKLQRDALHTNQAGRAAIVLGDDVENRQRDSKPHPV